MSMHASIDRNTTCQNLLVLLTASGLLAGLGACSAAGSGSLEGSGAASNAGGGGIIINPGTGGSGVDGDDNPQTCEEAAVNRTYVGCDFWPTVTYNPVYTNFDFAAVVANASSVAAEITVERGGNVVATATVAPGSLQQLALPWVNELKGPMFDARTVGSRVTSSIRVDGGAYHLTSSAPVTVWQFNPLQYEKDMSTCPVIPDFADGNHCLSVSNDAALLVPSTAMTGAYRVFGRSADNGGPDWGSTPGAFAITATEDEVGELGRPYVTHVDVQVAGDVAAGAGVPAASPGQVISFDMVAGDVVQLLGVWNPTWGSPHAELSGSVVIADKPVQVIATNPLSNVPDENTGYADHIEETVLPGEVIGNEYLVAAPTAPDATVVGHVVRFYGNVDGTTLTYPAGVQPPGAPTSLNAGDVVEIGPITQAFQVQSNQPFAVASFMLGGERQDPGGSDVFRRGDPAFSMMVAPAQFRTQYTFLAPLDYIENYADILVPAGATVTLDGAPLTGVAEPIGTSGWSVIRERLGPGNNGAHNLQSDQPVGLQVMGFGHATGYYYPGGLNLKLISAPPIIY